MKKPSDGLVIRLILVYVIVINGYQTFERVDTSYSYLIIQVLAAIFAFWILFTYREPKQ